MLLEMFRAMRAEINLRITNHTTLVSAKIVTTGVLLGFLLTQQLADENIDELRSLAFVFVPIIAFGYDAMIANNIKAIHLLGSYVRDRIESRFSDLDLWETCGAGPDRGGGQGDATQRNYNKSDTRVLGAFTLLTVLAPILALLATDNQILAVVVAVPLLIGFKLVWNLLDNSILLFIAPVATTVVALDVGGTTIKAALVVAEPLREDSGTGRVQVDVAGHRRELTVGDVKEISSASDEDRSTIIRNFLEIIDEVKSDAEMQGHRVDGVAVAIPGPTDYDLGIPDMKHKFAAIRGVELPQEIHRAFRLRSRFMNDAAAFSQGTWWAGNHPRRVLSLTLGTGIGADFLVAGHPAGSDDGAPPGGEIYHSVVVGEATLEDLVSARAITAQFLDKKRQAGAELDPAISVKRIADMARDGDPAARAAFIKFGRHLGTGLAPSLDAFRPSEIVIGGKVAAAEDLFLPTTRDALQACGHGDILITVAESAESNALMGVARHTIIGLNRSTLIARKERRDVDSWRASFRNWRTRVAAYGKKFHAWRTRHRTVRS